MSKELVPVMADAIREYYTVNELQELCGLFDSKLDWDSNENRPAHFRFAKRLIVDSDQGNNAKLLDAILPSLFVRCSEKIATTSWQQREHHQEVQARLERLRPLLDRQSSGPS